MKTIQNNISYHNPVLLKQSVNYLITDVNGNYVDATFGGGGHSVEILNNIENGHLFAFDQDEDAKNNLFEDSRFTFIDTNYSYLKNFLRYYNAIPVDGILADLGISSYQINTARKGFSTRFDDKLDMRMDQKNPFSAETVINEYDQHQLNKIFKVYGEIHNSWQLSKAIIEARKIKKIETTGQLVDIAQKFTPKNSLNKYLAKVFQAIRIEVNQELENLKTFLEKSLDVLKVGGRLVVISYHSLEDRLVKNFIKAGNFEGQTEKDFYGNIITPFKAISRKPIVPDAKELEDNPRSRSAKMRIAEKI